MGGRSWIAVAAGVLAALALIDAVAGPLLVQLGVTQPMTGFLLLRIALFEALLALPLGLVGLLRTGSASGRRGRGLAWLGVLGGGAVVGVVGAQILAVSDLPLINDITTSPDDPPLFFGAPGEPELAGRDWRYPADFGEMQRTAYPDLAPIQLAQPPDETFRRAMAAAESLGWEVTASDPSGRRFEARQTSRLFRFVDDIIVRVRAAEGAGSSVDVRSKSRDGKGDLGANAERIRAFAAALREET